MNSLIADLDIGDITRWVARTIISWNTHTHECLVPEKKEFFRISQYSTQQLLIAILFRFDCCPYCFTCPTQPRCTASPTTKGFSSFGKMPWTWKRSRNKKPWKSEDFLRKERTTVGRRRGLQVENVLQRRWKWLKIFIIFFYLELHLNVWQRQSNFAVRCKIKFYFRKKATVAISTITG